MGAGVGYAHCNIYILHSHLPMDLFHSFTSILHSDEGFLVNVRRFYGVYLLLQHGYLAVCLLERVLVLFLALESVSGSYEILRQLDSTIQESSVFPLFMALYMSP